MTAIDPVLPPLPQADGFHRLAAMVIRRETWRIGPAIPPGHSPATGGILSRGELNGLTPPGWSPREVTSRSRIPRVIMADPLSDPPRQRSSSLAATRLLGAPPHDRERASLGKSIGPPQFLS